MRKKLYFVLILSILFSCKEKVSIQPEYSDRTDWVPDIILTGNNYHRLRIEWHTLPPLELQRSIPYYIVDIKKANLDTSVLLDTVRTPAGIWDSYYVSPEIMQEDTAYSVELRIHYRSGVERESNSLDFTAARLKGQILKQLPVSIEYTIYGFDFEDGYFYYPAWWKIERIDAFSGASDLAYQTEDRSEIPGYYRGNFAVVGDEAILFYDKYAINKTSPGIELNLHTINLITWAARDTSVGIPLDTLLSSPAITFADDRWIYLMPQVGPTRWRIIRVDPFDPKNISTVSEFENNAIDFIGARGNMVFDGSYLWFNSAGYFKGSFDNILIRIDVSDGTVSNFAVPVYMPDCLAWDGFHFWVLDLDLYALTEIEVEPL
jgi:hypothetical protein